MREDGSVGTTGRRDAAAYAPPPARSRPKPPTKLGMLAGVVAVILTLAGCAPAADRGGPDPELRGQWELLSATDAKGTIPIENQLISLTIDGDTSTSGRSTCSDYSAHVFGSLTRLWITARLPAASHCGSKTQHDIEQRYIADLRRVRGSKLTGGILDLVAPGMDLKFQRALFVPLTLVVGRTWYLATVTPDDYGPSAPGAPFDQTGATMLLSKNGVLTGITECRVFTAHYVENAGEIVVSGYHSTGFANPCEGSERNADRDITRVVLAGFTFLSAEGELAIASPRAQLALGFID